MPRFCNRCNRPLGSPYHIYGVCDTVKLSDGRTVHRQRIEMGGDLHDSVGDDLQIVARNITNEMRSQFDKKEAL